MNLQLFLFLLITISNVVAAYSVYKFTRKAIPEIKAIRRATDVVKYHILRTVHDARKAEIDAQKNS